MKSWLTLLTFQLLNLLQVSLSQNACSRLPGLLNAHVSEQTRKDVYQLGETILFTCDTGFTSDLPIKYVCSSEGWVTLHQESCYSVKCQSLTVNDKIVVTGDPEDGTYGNVIRFSCKSRSEILKGLTEIYCDESGKWSGEVPECKEVTCDPPQITHGRVTDRPKVYKENHYLTFVCDKNYKPADERRSRCIKVGSEAVWSPTPQCLPILCKVNLPPIQGTTFNRYDRNVFSPGDTITVTCEGDHWIVDMKTTRTLVTCKDNGDWDITPECQDITCDENRLDRYLSSFYVPWGQRKINGRAMYECNSGYEKPDGVTHAICTRDGWMPERLCEEPCTVTKEEMHRNNLQLLKDWLDKIYAEHNDYLTFR